MRVCLVFDLHRSLPFAPQPRRKDVLSVFPAPPADFAKHSQVFACLFRIDKGLFLIDHLLAIATIRLPVHAIASMVRTVVRASLPVAMARFSGRTAPGERRRRQNGAADRYRRLLHLCGKPGVSHRRFSHL